jgi:hypothetical protein
MIIGAAQAQAQDKEKLIISFKIANPQASAYNSDSMVYKISSIVINNLNKTIPAYMDKNIQFNLERANAEISDSNIDFALPITVMSVNASKPNIVTSYETALTSSQLVSNVIKERNTLTNTATYSATFGIYEQYKDINGLTNSLIYSKATIYPNATGIMELREK